MAAAAKKGVTQKRLAEALNLTSRQVRNLTDDGTFSRKREGGELLYDLGECVQSYIKKKADDAAAKGGESKDAIAALNLRKLTTEVELEEMELAKERGQLVTLDYMEHQIKGLLESLRARCLNLPGKYARELAEAPDPASALVILERLSSELLQALSEAGEDPALDDEPEAPADAA